MDDIHFDYESPINRGNLATKPPYKTRSKVIKGPGVYKRKHHPQLYLIVSQNETVESPWGKPKAEVKYRSVEMQPDFKTHLTASYSCPEDASSSSCSFI